MKRLLILISCLFAISAGAEELTVTVSIPPQKYIVDKIAGGTLQVNIMADKGSDPHTFSPKASQAALLTKSTLYLGIGFPFEKSTLPRLAGSYELDIVFTEEGISFAEEEALPLSEKGHGAHAEHLDPHVWTSPRTMAIIAENTFNALISAHPEEIPLYTEGYAGLKAEITAWDEKFRALFQNGAPKSFLIYHPSLSYFARDYGLNQYTVEVDGKSPKARELAQVIKNVKALGITVFITQPQQSDEAAGQLARELGIKRTQIDILSEDWGQMMQTLYDAFADGRK